jgi:hypothetical protein
MIKIIAPKRSRTFYSQRVLLGLLALTFSFSALARQMKIEQPMAHAEQETQAFILQSDADASDFLGCWTDHSEERFWEIFCKANLTFVDKNTGEVSIHKLTCRFEYQPLQGEAKRYLTDSESNECRLK